LQYILWVFGILNSLDSKEFHIELEREILVVSKKFKIGVQHLKKVLCRNFGKNYRPKFREDKRKIKLAPVPGEESTSIDSAARGREDCRNARSSAQSRLLFDRTSLYRVSPA